MRKMSTGPIKTRISKFLFHQHLTPTTTTGNAPAELLLGRRPHSLIDVMKPDLPKTVRQHQKSQKQCHDDHVMVRSFEVGDSVFVCNFSPQHPHQKWLFGQICDIHRPVSYTVELHDDRAVRRHIDHIRRRTSTEPLTSPIAKSDTTEDIFDNLTIPVTSQLSLTSAPPLRRSNRTHRQPDWWVPA